MIPLRPSFAALHLCLAGAVSIVIAFPPVGLEAEHGLSSAVRSSEAHDPLILLAAAADHVEGRPPWTGIPRGGATSGSASDEAGLHDSAIFSGRRAQTAIVQSHAQARSDSHGSTTVADTKPPSTARVLDALPEIPVKGISRRSRGQSGRSKGKSVLPKPTVGFKPFSRSKVIFPPLDRQDLWTEAQKKSYKQILHDHEYKLAMKVHKGRGKASASVPSSAAGSEGLTPKVGERASPAEKELDMKPKSIYSREWYAQRAKDDPNFLAKRRDRQRRIRKEQRKLLAEDWKRQSEALGADESAERSEGL